MPHENMWVCVVRTVRYYTQLWRLPKVIFIVYLDKLIYFTTRYAKGAKYEMSFTAVVCVLVVFIDSSYMRQYVNGVPIIKKRARWSTRVSSYTYSPSRITTSGPTSSLRAYRVMCPPGPQLTIWVLRSVGPPPKPCSCPGSPYSRNGDLLGGFHRVFFATFSGDFGVLRALGRPWSRRY